MSKAAAYKRILVVRLDRIGDVVLSSPVIAALRKAYPDSHIAFMVRPYASPALAGHPGLDEVIAYDKSMGLAGTMRFIHFLRKQRFDLAIVLHPTARSHMLMYCAGIPERVGYDRKGGRFLTRRIPHTKQLGLRHESDYALEVLRYIGVEPAAEPLHMRVAPETEERVRLMLAAHGIGDGERIVTICPGASCASKRWAPSRFAAIADDLASKRDVKIVIVGAPADRPAASAVVQAMRSAAVDLTGTTTVDDVAAIAKRSRLFISNDSGPVHIACAVGAPVISIFGRADRGLSPRRWGPRGSSAVAIHKDAGCVTCLAHRCRSGYRCLEAVTVSDVMAAADRLLGAG